MKRIALIGAGCVARVHAEALRHMPDTRIAAVGHRSAGAAAALAALRPGAKVFRARATEDHRADP